MPNQDHTTQPLTNDQIEQIVAASRGLADWWAHRLQWCEDDHEDLVQTALFELFRTLKGYQRSGRPIQHPQGLASTVLSSAIKWYYKPTARQDREVPYGEQEPTIPVDGHAAYWEQTYQEEYLAEIRRLHGALAARIASNLLRPEPAVLRTSPHTGRITHAHIRTTLHVSESTWNTLLTRIRTSTRRWVQRQTLLPNRTEEAVVGLMHRSSRVPGSRAALLD